jgi:hypothetical protein
LFKRVAVAFLAALIGPSFLGISTVFATSYYTTCSASENNYIYHNYQLHAAVQKSVRGTAIIRDLRTCIDANGKLGASQIMVANLQDSDCSPFAQLGYGRVGNDSNPLGFWFTPDPYSAPCGSIARLRDYFQAYQRSPQAQPGHSPSATTTTVYTAGGPTGSRSPAAAPTPS